MSINDCKSKMSIAHVSTAGANTLESIVRRWWVTPRAIGKALSSIRDPRLRAEALAAMCEALLRQFDDEQAGAAEIRLVVHKRETERVSAPRLDPDEPVDAEGEELLWELRRLLASSGGTIADVAHALERRGDEVDRKGRDLLQDEVGAIEIDIAVLKTLLSDPIDWDAESRRLLAGEVPPFEDHAVDDDDEDD